MKKLIYEAPQVQVINMEVQGIIAGSPIGGVGGNDPYGAGGDPFGS